MKRNLFFEAATDIGGGTGTSAEAGSTSDASASTDAEGKANAGKTDTSELPKTDEELQNYISSQLEQQLAERQKQWTLEHEKKLEQAKTEAERLAKLSADEREKELLKLKTEEFAKKENEFRKKELVFEATKLLATKGLSPDFAAMLAGENAEQTKANIDLLEKQIKTEIEKGIIERLKSKSPLPNQPTEVTGTADFMKAIASNKLR